ncbi:hypothetical protein [Vitiosangium sp. GDMCC 1.1324]|uniref:hypothetical protein n=1 Tax=Vitiosangium sp. (strain GDMCC 1.1324) TaxID=2138576 RepID=UPI000D35ADCB|nr:hypothetical protein [Vitiosangium sp. GDMCC 1.1324]PTL81154.1 hypothetical protein DAT35_23810 [Vitiosangium sp. GDMCC 1.1324]
MRSSPAQALLPLLLVLAAPSFADVAPDPLAGISEPHPMDAKAARGISMKYEEVIIELHDAYAIIDATFTMANPGKAKELQVGFPGRGVPLERGFAVHEPLVGFSAWVGDKSVSSEDKELVYTYDWGPPGSGYKRSRRESWHVFTVPFAQGDTKLRVRYGVVTKPYTGGSWSSDEKLDDREAWYILATGGRWAGPIGEAVIRVKARGGVKPQSIRIRDGHMTGAIAKSNGETAAAMLPSYATRDAEGVTLQRKKLEARLEDNLQIVYRADRKQLPETQSEWDTRPAAALLRKAMGLKDEAAAPTPQGKE